MRSPPTIQQSSRITFAILLACVVWTLAGPRLFQAQPPQKFAVSSHSRWRARDLGIAPGTFAPGRWNALTDVDGVRVGHVSLIEGKNIRTGITAILPPGENPFGQKFSAAIVVGNGFGKLIGSTQVHELGVIETPILLTNTLNVWRVADALVDYMLALPGNENVRSINPVVGETNDGFLNDIRGRHVSKEDVLAAIRDAKSGPLEEGSVGAGVGTMAFGWKGGMGTSSRVLPVEKGAHKVGVLVQTNFGGHFTLDGVPIWRELPAPAAMTSIPSKSDGSCMIVVATDAPLDARQLQRVAKRALAGMARTGASFSHGSGDYVIAFSTFLRAEASLRESSNRTPMTVREEDLSSLFEATAEATEEAIYNSLLKANTILGVDGHKAEAIPLDALRQILTKYGRGPQSALP